MKKVQKIINGIVKIIGYSMIFMVLNTVLFVILIKMDSKKNPNYCEGDSLFLGDGSYAIESREENSKVINGLVVYESKRFTLKQCTQDNSILDQVTLYHYPKDSNLLYLVGTKLDQDKYVIFDPKKNNYVVYENLHTIPEKEKNIFEQTNLFSNLEEIMNQKHKKLIGE